MKKGLPTAEGSIVQVDVERYKYLNSFPFCTAEVQSVYCNFLAGKIWLYQLVIIYLSVTYNKVSWRIAQYD